MTKSQSLIQLMGAGRLLGNAGTAGRREQGDAICNVEADAPLQPLIAGVGCVVAEVICQACPAGHL